MSMKPNTLVISLGIVLVAGLAYLVLVNCPKCNPWQKTANASPVAETQTAETQTVTDANGSMTQLQVLTIDAKGGYTPRDSIAKAGVPTLLNIKTNSTFDCSAALVIPALNYRTRLPFSGTTSVNIPPQEAGTELTGLCAMGMYSFTIKFMG